MWGRKRRHTTETPEEEGEGQTAEKKRSGWYLRFARQELKGWSPILKGKAVVLYLVGVAVLLLALGIPILTASTGIVEYSVRYDDQGPLASLNSTEREQRIQAAGDDGIAVPISFLINKTMNPPVGTRTPAAAQPSAKPSCIDLLAVTLCNTPARKNDQLCGPLADRTQLESQGASVAPA